MLVVIQRPKSTQEWHVLVSLCLLVKLYQFFSLLDKHHLQQGGAETVHHQLHQLVPSSACPTQHCRWACKDRTTRWQWGWWSLCQGVPPSMWLWYLPLLLGQRGQLMSVCFAVNALKMSGCYMALRTLEGPDSLQTLWEDKGHFSNCTKPLTTSKDKLKWTCNIMWYDVPWLMCLL